MPVTALVGLQWGDEGKGKVVDALSGSMDLVVRAQGGANAGHTVKVGGRTRVLHLVPSGMFYPHVEGIIGNGVVVDPLQLVQELEELEACGMGVDGRLRISDRAHLVLPHHKRMDALQEVLRGPSALGTTHRGIGPAYMDKAARAGVRAGEMRRERAFRVRVGEAVAAKNRILEALGEEPLDAEACLEPLMAARKRLLPLVVDTVSLLHDALEAERHVLLEGAQGTLLDLDLGTYPYVTSSNCHIGGLLAGSGLPPRSVDRVLAVAKAYCTRVGAGPFPSEETGGVGEEIRARGSEYGATTGRPRRCGWFDAVAARFAVRLNGVDEIVLTKLDVLAGLDTVRICTGYRLEGRKIRDFPAGEELQRVEPVFEELEGFDADLASSGCFEDLPRAAREFVGFVERTAGARVSRVSTGPERDESLTR